MDKRRATSLGKGSSRASSSAAAAARLARTSSWNAGMDGANQTTQTESPAPLSLAAIGKVLRNGLQQQQQQQVADDAASRHRRPSMRRMVRFRMSTTDVDPRRSTGGPAAAAPSPAVETETVDEGNSHRRSNNESGGDERSTPPAALLWLPNEGETPGARPVSSSCAGVEAGTQTRTQDQSADTSDGRSWDEGTAATHNPSEVVTSSSNSPRPVLVQQVSRFSVMQTTLEDPLQSIHSVDSVLSNDTNNNGGRTRRQRGRSGRPRDNRQTRSRSRRHRSGGETTCSTTASRDSTPDTPIVRSSRRRRNPEANVDPEEESRRNQIGMWPHSMSSLFALLAATLGLFNISRFALLSIEYGGNFIVQFVLLTFLFGIPMLCFHGCLGQFLGSGIIDMWKISPIFKGVGISLLIAQAVEGVYTIVGIAWMFFYFRDSFIAQEDTYKWTRCPDLVRKCSPPTNYSYSLEDTVPDYFHARVLQRTSVSEAPLSFISLKFEIAFNLAVIWMIIFVALGKGLRSYGKAVYAFGTLPLLGYFVVCIKILGVSSSFPYSSVSGILEHTPWKEFFTDTKVWVVAAREVFLTWGLCGAIVMQITSHNRYHHSLRRDIAGVIIITLLVLLLSAFVASACVQIIGARGLDYLDNSSFETDKTYKFLRSDSVSSRFRHTPPSSRSRGFHNNLLMGISVRPSHDDSPYDRSGYSPIRLATELIPAVVAVIGPLEFSPFWAVLFYFSLVAFGIAHQLAIWHCVISGFVAFRSCCLKSWETTITFFTCALGFLFSLPLATELGISIVYLLDYVMGASWWLMIIYVIEIAAVLIVRGRPYSGESIVAVLVKGSGCMANWCNPLLSFSWSVVLPIGLLVLSISSFKTGNFRDIFTWDKDEGYRFWPIWARQSGTMIQLITLLLVPATGVVQSIRYLSTGPADLFERVKLLYRPQFRTYIIRPNESESRRNQRNQNRQRRSARSRSRSPSPGPTAFVDPPPKYTPPPTYNTATGARIAKLLRESIRRSIRQIRDMATPVQSPGNTVNSIAALAVMEMGSRPFDSSDHQVSSSTPPNMLPPAYTSVVMEMQDNASDSSASSSDGVSDRLSGIGECDSAEATTSSTVSSESGESSGQLTAAEVTRLLRESFRRSARNTMLMFRGRKAASDAASATTTTTAVTDDEDEATDTDGALVISAARIHRDPSIVVTLPTAGEESMA